MIKKQFVIIILFLSFISMVCANNSEISYQEESSSYVIDYKHRIENRNNYVGLSYSNIYDEYGVFIIQCSMLLIHLNYFSMVRRKNSIKGNKWGLIWVFD